MPNTFDVACHGLAIGWPIDELARWLNDNTPAGVHFNVVGGLDPQAEEGSILQSLLDAAARGEPPIFIGHSKGAMLAFYAADQLKAKKLRAPLFVSVDSTCWGSNVPGTIPWGVLLSANAGVWLVPDNIDRWLHFYQDGYPGGGQAHPAPGNHTNNLQTFHLPGESHLSIVNSAMTRTKILEAVLEIAQGPPKA